MSVLRIVSSASSPDFDRLLSSLSPTCHASCLGSPAMARFVISALSPDSPAYFSPIVWCYYSPTIRPWSLDAQSLSTCLFIGCNACDMVYNALQRALPYWLWETLGCHALVAHLASFNFGCLMAGVLLFGAPPEHGIGRCSMGMLACVLVYGASKGLTYLCLIERVGRIRTRIDFLSLTGPNL
ncbi:hypothetical protein AG1IA_08762 [Rhizoctonia solani AG-1 IA]|uniref:Uncharacterized protein n=1 Tax=Thanatephorus cucumeris (strain AG1-IA) TaxID=983506 RepID=L8WLJ0_THACA|nr:hypothetical protein AG1IA_08762 [Rhizoctonia solani AG-1 IA]